jgi:hypothetical protein
VGRRPERAQSGCDTSGYRNLYGLEAVVTPGTSTPNAALNTTGGIVMGAAGSLAGVCISFAIATVPAGATPPTLAVLLAAPAVFSGRCLPPPRRR